MCILSIRLQIKIYEPRFLIKDFREITQKMIKVIIERDSTNKKPLSKLRLLITLIKI